jgi:hypothetical protein
MLGRALERGELGPDTDPDLTQDVFGGPLCLHGVMLDRDFPPGYAQCLTETVLRALGAKSPDGS